MNFCDEVGAGRMLAGGWGGESASGTSGQSIALCVLCPFLSPPQMQLLLSWFPRHLSLCHLGTAPSACLSSAMCLLAVVPSDLLSVVIQSRLGSPSQPLPSFLQFFFEVGELSLSLLALMNLRQR